MTDPVAAWYLRGALSGLLAEAGRLRLAPCWTWYSLRFKCVGHVASFYPDERIAKYMVVPEFV